MKSSKTALTTNPFVGLAASIPINAYCYDLFGNLQSEFTNHLGNVLTVVSDKKLPVETSLGSGIVGHYVADVISATDYYAFGSPMQGRKHSPNAYRYGFNGKETDDETGTQDYGMRIYNPALGRFLSVDPITKSYPELTPYQFASNTPIQAIDLDGLEAAGYQFRYRFFVKAQLSAGLQAKFNVHIVQFFGLNLYGSGPAAEGTTTFHVDYYQTDDVWDPGVEVNAKDISSAGGIEGLSFGHVKSYEADVSSLDANENKVYPNGDYHVKDTYYSAIFEETDTDYKSGGNTASRYKFSLANIDVRLLVGAGAEITFERTEVPIGAGMKTDAPPVVTPPTNPIAPPKPLVIPGEQKDKKSTTSSEYKWTPSNTSNTNQSTGASTATTYQGG